MENAREAFEKLRQEVTSGNISCDDIIKRLTVAIEAEYHKDTPNIDFINSCEVFLWELGTQGQQAYVSSNQRYIQAINQASIVKRDMPSSWRIRKRFAVIAAVFLLVFGLGQGVLRFRWFTHDSDQDGEIYIIQGHEITLELIQSALAEHQSYTTIETCDFEVLSDFLGFKPSIVAPNVLQASTVLYSAHLEPGLIIVDALYRSSEQNTIAVLKLEYYIDIEEAYLVIEQDTHGDYLEINGYQVYHNSNMGRQSFSWLSNSTLTHLSGTFDVNVGIHIINLLTGGSQNE